MKAIILVGGFGTRLRPLTLQTPKCLLPVLNRPFIHFQLDILKQGGIKEVMFATGHLSEVLARSFKGKNPWNIKIQVATEKFPLGTGGAIRHGFDKFKANDNLEPIVVFNGDVFLDLNLKKFLQFHKKNNSRCSIALTQVSDASRFGVVKMNPKGKINRFLEKPKHFKGHPWVNAGAYILNAGQILKIPPRRAVSIEKESFPRFLNSGDRLFGFRLKGYWNDIGTPQTYLEAHRDLMGKKFHWTHHRLFRKRGVLVGKNSNVSRSAVLGKTACLGNWVTVGAGSKIENCVILDHVQIGNETHIKDSVIGPGSRIGSHCHIGPNAVLGPQTKLTDFSRC